MTRQATSQPRDAPGGAPVAISSLQMTAMGKAGARLPEVFKALLSTRSAPARGLRGALCKIDVTFNGDATVDATFDVIAQTKIDCSSESIAKTGGQVTFPDARTEGDCIGDDIRSDGKDPTNHTISLRSAARAACTSCALSSSQGLSTTTTRSRVAPRAPRRAPFTASKRHAHQAGHLGRHGHLLTAAAGMCC